MTNEQRKKTAIRIEKQPGQKNGLKTACTSAVLEAMGVEKWNYSQTKNDVVNILRRNGFAVRSRGSRVTKKIFRVAHIKNDISRFSQLGGKFIVFVEGHVLLLDDLGKTIVDTDSRKVDRRRIVNIYEIN